MNSTYRKSLNELLKGRKILINAFESGIFPMGNIDIDVNADNVETH